MSRANTQCVNQGSFCHFFSVIVQGEGPLSYRLMKTMRAVIKLLTALILHPLRQSAIIPALCQNHNVETCQK